MFSSKKLGIGLKFKAEFIKHAQSKIFFGQKHVQNAKKFPNLKIEHPIFNSYFL